MAYEVRTEQASPRALAAARAATTGPQLGADIVRLLDLVWPVLRQQDVTTGHNVVVYYNGQDGGLTIDAGVEAFSGFRATSDVRPASTPAGEVATTTHHGEFWALAGAYAALQQWCADNRRRPAGVNWEVYGDTDPDPAKQRTDIYFLLEPAAPPGRS